VTAWRSLRLVAVRALSPSRSRFVNAHRTAATNAQVYAGDVPPARRSIGQSTGSVPRGIREVHHAVSPPGGCLSISEQEKVTNSNTAEHQDATEFLTGCQRPLTLADRGSVRCLLAPLVHPGSAGAVQRRLPVLGEGDTVRVLLDAPRIDKYGTSGDTRITAPRHPVPHRPRLAEHRVQPVPAPRLLHRQRHAHGTVTHRPHHPEPRTAEGLRRAAGQPLAARPRAPYSPPGAEEYGGRLPAPSADVPVAHPGARGAVAARNASGARLPAPVRPYAVGQSGPRTRRRRPATTPRPCCAPFPHVCVGNRRPDTFSG